MNTVVKRLFAFVALLLFLVIAGGLIWLATVSDNAVSALLSYAAGLSMIFLPCTLPLVFVIVPLSAREEKAGRALGTALAFALGLAVTLALYGILTALLGSYFGLDSITRTMFVVAGAMALIFALAELGLVRIPLPVFTHRVPNWTQGYTKSFFLGLFLGNAGIGCPNPAFYVLLTYIASTGSVLAGGWLGFIHGLGRATPLILLVLLAIIGIRSTRWIEKASKRINLWIGGLLVIAGAFILTYGLFGMHWWEDSIFHAAWNDVVMNIAPNLAEDPNHPVAQGVFEGSAVLGWLSFILFMFIPLLWYKFKRGMSGIRFFIYSALLTALLVLAVSGTLTVEEGHGHGESENHAFDSSSYRLPSRHPPSVYT